MKYKTIPDMFYSQAGARKGKVVRRYKKEGRWTDVTWDEAAGQVELFAMGLIGLGIMAGERVAILSENRNEWYTSDLAIQSCGGVVVPIYDTDTPEQIKYIINDSGAVAVVVSTAGQLRKLDAVRDEVPGLLHIITLDPVPPGADSVIHFERVLSLGRSSGDRNELVSRLAGISSDDPATIIYTSGTTGDPKGVVLTHRNLLSDVESSFQMMKDEIGDEEVMLSFLPLSHSFARTADYYVPLYHGKGLQVLAESLEKLPENILEVRPTMFASVPRVFEKVYGKIIATIDAGSPVKKKIFYWAASVGRRASAYVLENRRLPFPLSLEHRLATMLVFKKIRERVGGRLKFAVSGGAPLSRELGEFFFALGIKIIEGYGLTETSPALTINPPDKIKFGTVGRPIPGCEIRIAGDGEILARGPMIMKGYYKNPEATAEAIDENGWFHTGDVGFLDREGYLHITDRKKDIIVTAGGKNIAPQPIENRLKMSRYIEEVVIIGDRRPYCSALIVPSIEALEDAARKEGITYASKEELLDDPKVKGIIDMEIAEVNKGLPKYETIKKFALIPAIFTQETGELTPTLKVKRWAVEKKYQDVVERMYEGLTAPVSAGD